MRAAVTEGRHAMRIVDVPDPGDPGAVDDSQLYPRIQGHEAAGVLEAVGPDAPKHLEAGQRVAIWPLGSCGHCYPCRIGRPNVCSNISLVGVHRDGALQERLRLRAEQVFPVGDQDPSVAALIEPVSIAVRSVVRGRVAAGEKVVVFGAGPIGQAIAAASIDRGGSVLLLDRVAGRLERAKPVGADTFLSDGEGTSAAVREWAGA